MNCFLNIRTKGRQNHRHNKSLNTDSTQPDKFGNSGCLLIRIGHNSKPGIIGWGYTLVQFKKAEQPTRNPSGIENSQKDSQYIRRRQRSR